jgi:hypothetical protein
MFTELELGGHLLGANSGSTILQSRRHRLRAVSYEHGTLTICRSSSRDSVFILYHGLQVCDSICLTK